jgi:hypothetical protein
VFEERLVACWPPGRRTEHPRDRRSSLSGVAFDLCPDFFSIGDQLGIVLRRVDAGRGWRPRSRR